MAKVHEALGKERSADRMYSKAVELGEELRMSRLLSERKGFFAEPVGGFKPLEAGNGLIRIKLKVNRARDSIYPGELSKARIFADSIGRRADISKMGAPKELISEEEMLFNRLASLKKALSALPKSKAPTRYREISQQIKIAEREILAFEKKVKSSYKQYASVRFPDPVKLSNARLNPDQYYLVYDVLENGVAIRLLKGKSVVETTFSKLDRGELIRMIREFRSSFEQARLGAFNVDLAERLYGILVKPVIGEVPKGVNLIIVPDDALSILPFEALVESGSVEWKAADWGPYPSGLKYLFDRNPINLRQSLTAITLAKTLEFGKNDGRSLLVLADPVFQAADERAGRALASRNEEVSAGPNVVVMEAISEYSKLGFQLNRLKATGKLADKLGDMFPGAAKVFKGISANKETLFNDKGPELGRFRWVVLATHGYAAADMPGIMEPFIALSMIPRSQDGFLRMTEVLDLKLNADLVALTACQTGHGKIIPGEGVISLGRAFQCAGARSTLVSLWSVSEITSVKLMEMFFERLKEGEKTGQAWRKARLNLRSSGYDHPFFWAPFIMVGQAN
jgi:CHAT domain-containing protein